MDTSGNDHDRVPDAKAVLIPPHGEHVASWRQVQKGGTRDDRTLREVTVRLPPMIADYAPDLPLAVTNQAEEAQAAITRLDSRHGKNLSALSALLLRAESVASSKIEHVEASLENYARAAHGSKANSSATSMVASAEALSTLISSVDDHGAIVVADIKFAHRVLMTDDVAESQYAGRLRDMQNWIGGSDFSPRNADYVPPPAETVVGYLDDLLESANRDDLPVLAQAAIAHAQFESIHPFTDGNGRIGRALINTILRRRGATTRVVIPLASALVARKEDYFEVLAAYREGDAGPIIRAFARAAHVTAREASTSGHRLAELPQHWLSAYADAFGRPPRGGSAAHKILDRLVEQPFFTTDDMEDDIGGSTSSVYTAIEKLSGAGILRPLTSKKRRQVWCAAEVVDELQDLSTRIASQTTADPEWRAIRSQTAVDLAGQTTARLAQINSVFENAMRSDTMKRSFKLMVQGSSETQAQLTSSLHIPESVRAIRHQLHIPDEIKKALDLSSSMAAPAGVIQEKVAQPSLQRSMKQLSELSKKLTLDTRLPDSVIKALKEIDMPDTHQHPDGPPDGAP